MTYNRPGRGTHKVNTLGRTINHNDPVSISGHVGVAVKQKQHNTAEGIVGGNVIATGERFWLIKKGIVQVPFVAGMVDGDPVYIVAADGTLTETASGNVKFGRVVEVTGDGRGVPPGKVRVDLDDKDSF